jgi:PAS domain S-box-containing protein
MMDGSSPHLPGCCPWKGLWKQPRKWEHAGQHGSKLARKLKTDDRQKLRAEAEARFAGAPPTATPNQDPAALLHELQVHQIELEMQNEELRRSKLELEEAHNRQVDLYDFAPVGYVTLDGDGVIISANLTAATLLGVERGSMLRRRFPGFVANADGDRWHRAFLARLQGEERAVHRLTLSRGDGVTFDADVVCELRSGDDGHRVHIVLTDVTEIARIERESHETKERLSLVLDSTGAGYTDWDIPRGRVKYSKQFANMLGYDLGELAPTVATWEGLVHPDDRQRAWDAAQPHLRGETEQYECEERLRHKDGRWRWTVLRAKVMARDAAGAPLRFVGTHTDITERRRLDEALRASEEHQRNLVDNLDAGVVVHAPDTSIVQSNVRASVLLGLTRDQLSGKAAIDPAWRFVHEDGSPMPLPEYPVNQVIASGSSVVGQIIGIDRAVAGDRAWVLVNAYPELDEAGALRQVVVTFVDITGRVAAEQALRVQGERLALAVRGGGLGLWDWDLLSGRCTYNERWASMLGYALDEIEPSASVWEKLLHPDDMARVQPILEANLRGEASSWTWEQRLRHKDGHWVWILGAGAVVERAPDGTPLRAAGTHADITERKEVEEALVQARRAAEGRARELQAVLDAVPAAIFITRDPAAQHMETNRLGAEMMKLSVHTNVSKSAPPGEAPRTFRAMKNGLELSVKHLPVQVAAAKGVEVKNYEFDLVAEGEPARHMFGNAYPLLDESGAPAGAVGAFVDVTAQRTMQGQLQVASRLAAMGTLVAGVAHEINNPLAGTIAGQGSTIEDLRELRERAFRREAIDPDALVRELDEDLGSLTDAQVGAQRIARIVKDLVTFGRPDPRRTRVRLVDVLEEAMRWLPGSMVASAIIHVLNDQAPDVVGSSGQLGQVIVNLVTNGAKSIPLDRRGVVTIRIGPGSRGMARIEVTDDGSGIQPEVLPRIFDPFFTTREVGQGMGLGLAICHAIVTAHGGTLTVESEVGKGSMFRVELPAAPVEA